LGRNAGVGTEVEVGEGTGEAVAAVGKVSVPLDGDDGVQAAKNIPTTRNIRKSRWNFDMISTSCAEGDRLTG
jgi:hypothetical protein